MAEPTEIRKDRLGLLLGKMAMDRGLITPDQLKEALVEQARDLAAGKKLSRPLGVILVAKGYLSDERLVALLGEQKAKSLAPRAVRQQDMVLGRLLLEHRLAGAEHVNECLRLQAEALEAGQENAPRLGELLVQKGYATAETIRRALSLQKKTILACSSCGRRYNVSSFDPAKAYRCKACEGALGALPSTDTVRVDDSTILPASPDAAPAAGPRAPAPSARRSPMDAARATAGGKGKEGAAFPPFGKYTILRELGRGGMGVVYESLDTQLNRKAALKMIFTSPNADPKEAAQDEERFLREARLTASLAKHPGIVGVYEAGIIDGRRYLAMEFVEGRPVSEWRKMGSVSLRQQVTLLRDVALAVHHAHEHGVIHRDLKPANVLVDAKNHPFITDFGLAKTVGQHAAVSLTASGMIVGTPTYMSPEQAQGFKTVDRRTDVYALGVMLYELLTGRTPFVGDSAIEVLMKVVKDPIPPLSIAARGKRNPLLDGPIENICLKALARDPADRYDTAKSFAEDLTRWLKGEEVDVEPPLAQRLHWGGKLPTWVYAGAVALLIVLLFLFLWPSTPSVDDELSRGRGCMREGRYQDALTAYVQALAKDPDSVEARSGKREAQRRLDGAVEAEKQTEVEKARRAAEWAAEEKTKATVEEMRRKAEADAKANEGRLRREAEEARAAADKARREAEEKAKTEAEAKLQEERGRLAVERRAAEERARTAEEAARRSEDEAKKAQEQLKLAAAAQPPPSESPAPPPAAHAKKRERADKDDIVKNGDFEHGFHDVGSRPNVARNWSIFNKNPNYGYEQGSGFRSRSSQGLSCAAAPWDCGVYQVVEVTPGAVYRFSMVATYADSRKVDGEAFRFWVGFDLDGEEWERPQGGFGFPPNLRWEVKDVLKAVNDAGGPGSWAEVRSDVTAKGDKLGVWIWGAGATANHRKYIDKVSLRPKDEVPPAPASKPARVPGAPMGMKFLGTNPLGCPEFQHSDGSVMVLIPEGEFEMGSNASDDEKPIRKVALDAYLIDKTEVTWAQYTRFCQAAGRPLPPAPSWGIQENHPVVNVTWEDAVAYCRWAGKRLPTEAEWEKASRGAGGRVWPWGSAWEGGKSNLEGVVGKTAPVGSFASDVSPWGVLDMGGNVSEWCADWYDPGYYAKAESRDPRGPASGRLRSIRGGTWVRVDKQYSRSANRDGIDPKARCDAWGFRGALDVPGTGAAPQASRGTAR